MSRESLDYHGHKCYTITKMTKKDETVKMANANFHMEFIKVDTEREGMRLYDAKSAPLRLYGVFHDGKCYRRLPENVAEATNPGVVGLSKNTAGGRVRFTTDSPYVFIKTVYNSAHVMTHMPLSGSSSFDMYVYEDGKEIYDSTFRAPMPEETVGGYESIRDWGTRKMRTVNINFPLYNDVDELYIGLDENAAVEPAPDYKYEKPIVYYGSSITQGGCASRPGTCYQGFVTRHFDINHVNLGFSGNARAEDAIAEYIAGLDMSAFVYDYDHNAPTKEHLAQTHERMFGKIREKNPTLPIIMMSRPRFKKSIDELSRFEIIKRTYENAKAECDKNVYLIDGSELCLDNENTVDGCHPTDYGFKCMADRLIKELSKIIK